MGADKVLIILAYRNLYRSALHAVQYSIPARYILRETLRNAFRNGNPGDFNPPKIGNTILFLENAAEVKGPEHRILKNLVHVRWWERSTRRMVQYVQSAVVFGDILTLANAFRISKQVPEVAELEKAASKQYEVTLKMLNESMDLCLQ